MLLACASALRLSAAKMPQDDTRAAWRDYDVTRAPLPRTMMFRHDSAVAGRDIAAAPPPHAATGAPSCYDDAFIVDGILQASDLRAIRHAAAMFAADEQAMRRLRRLRRCCAPLYAAGATP